MHDVHRDSLIHKKKKKSGSISEDRGQMKAHHDHEDHKHDHDHDHHAHDDHDHDHDHDDHEVPHGHDHPHEEEDYHAHDADLHVHEHHEHEVFGDRTLGDRAYAHLHDHKHVFFHQHHHSHHEEHTGLVHKVFKDPVRDWFALAFMGLLIAAGYFKWLPGALSEGMLVCAAVIGIFPVAKNAFFECIAKRTVSFEFIISLLLIGALFTGEFLIVALIALFLLAGSFMRLNFSWRSE